MKNKSNSNNIDKQTAVAKIEKEYLCEIISIYNKYQVNPYSDIEKHNGGIIKAMIEFALYYKEHTDKYNEAIDYVKKAYVDDSKELPALLIGNVAQLIEIFTGKNVDWNDLLIK